MAINNNTITKRDSQPATLDDVNRAIRAVAGLDRETLKTMVESCRTIAKERNQKSAPPSLGDYSHHQYEEFIDFIHEVDSKVRINRANSSVRNSEVHNG